MKQLWKKYRYSLIVLQQLVKTDFKLRYQGSILGIAWSVLKPLMLFAVMYTVFVHFLRFTDGSPLFAVNLLLGLGLWQFFSESTIVGLHSIVLRGEILRKVHFPNHIVVVSATIGSLIGLGINTLVVLVFALASGASFSWYLLLVPLNLVELYAITLGMALLLATWHVKFRDVAHIWDVCLQIGFYAVPIIYPLALVQNNYPQVGRFMLLNPITQIIQDIRHNLIDPVNVTTIWDAHSLGFCLIPVFISLAIFGFGIRVFKRSSKKFVEIL